MHGWWVDGWMMAGWDNFSFEHKVVETMSKKWGVVRIHSVPKGTLETHFRNVDHVISAPGWENSPMSTLRKYLPGWWDGNENQMAEECCRFPRSSQGAELLDSGWVTGWWVDEGRMTHNTLGRVYMTELGFAISAAFPRTSGTNSRREDLLSMDSQWLIQPTKGTQMKEAADCWAQINTMTAWHNGAGKSACAKCY